MPKPPLLPTIDWQQVHSSGVDYDTWIANAESEDNRKAMEQLFAEQVIEPQVQAMLGALPRTVNVVAIAEDWCGDVVRHAPVLGRIAQCAPKLDLRFVTREQHPDVFVRFLTNGGEAIPKFVFLSGQWVECGNWGPMPEAGRRLISRGKACGDVGAARQKVSALYNADHDRRVVVDELVALITTAGCDAP